VRWPTIFAMVWAAIYRDGRLFLQWYGRLCGEMAGYFCSGMGGYVVRWPAIFAVVWWYGRLCGEMAGCFCSV
jgi:hypothetical protein